VLPPLPHTRAPPPPALVRRRAPTLGAPQAVWRLDFSLVFQNDMLHDLISGMFTQSNSCRSGAIDFIRTWKITNEAQTVHLSEGAEPIKPSSPGEYSVYYNNHGPNLSHLYRLRRALTPVRALASVPCAWAARTNSLIRQTVRFVRCIDN